MSFACSVNFLCAFILAMAVPQFTEASAGSTDLPKGRYMNLFGSFAGLTWFSAILVFLFLRNPEPMASLGDYNVSHPSSFLVQKVRHTEEAVTNVA